MSTLSQVNSKILQLFSKYSEKPIDPINRHQHEAAILTHVFSVAIESVITIMIYIITLFGFLPQEVGSSHVEGSILSCISLGLLYFGQMGIAALVLVLGKYIPLAFLAYQYPLITLAALPVTSSLSVVMSGRMYTKYINMGLSLLMTIYAMPILRQQMEYTSPMYQQVEIMCKIFIFNMVQSYSLAYIMDMRIGRVVNLLKENIRRAESINEALVEAVDSKKSFLACLSDEIRNPLNSVIGNLDYLSKTISDRSCSKMVRNVRLASNLLLNVVSSILDAAKIQQDGVELQYKNSSVQEMMEQLVLMYKDSLVSKKLRIMCQIDKNVPKSVFIDSSRLIQILTNVVSNAIKFSQESQIIKIVAWFEDLKGPTMLKRSTIDLDSFGHVGGSGNNGGGNSILDDFIAHTELKSKRAHSEVRAGSQTANNEQTQEPQPLKMFPRLQSAFNLQRKPTDYSEGVPKERDMRDADSDEMVNSFEPPKTMNQVNVTNKQTVEKYSLIESTLDKDDFLKVKMQYGEFRSVAHRKRNGTLKIRVEDQGCGISKNQQEQIFDLFNQGQDSHDSTNEGDSLTRNFRGAGLGLWIVQKIISAMDGKVEVASEPNHGAAFTISLPIRNDMMVKESSEDVLGNHLAKKLRVLCVDDLKYNLDLHKFILEESGAEVETAENGQEALEKFTSKPEKYYKFILTDLQMPVMNGIVSCQKIREFEAEYKRLPVDIYILSGNCYENEIDECMNPKKGVRAQEFLKKPLAVKQIRTILKKYNSLNGLNISTAEVRDNAKL